MVVFNRRATRWVGMFRWPKARVFMNRATESQPEAPTPVSVTRLIDLSIIYIYDNIRVMTTAISHS